MAWVTIRQMHERVADVMSEIGIKAACQRAARRAEADGLENSISRMTGRLWYVNDESEQARRWLARQADHDAQAELAARGSEAAEEVARVRAEAALNVEDADRRIEAADRERDEMVARVADLESQLAAAEHRARQAQEQRLAERREAQERAEDLSRTILELQSTVVDWQRRTIEAQDALAALRTEAGNPNPGVPGVVPAASELETINVDHADEAVADAEALARTELDRWRAHPTPLPSPRDHETVVRVAHRYQALCRAVGEAVTNRGLAEVWVKENGDRPSAVLVGQRLKMSGIKISEHLQRRSC